MPGRNRLRIPFEFINDELNVDIKRGAYVVKVNRYLECLCSGNSVPRSITVDLAGSMKGKPIRLCDIKLPSQVRPTRSVPDDLVIAIVKSGRGG